VPNPRRKKGYLYPPTKYGRCRILGRIIRPPEQKSGPLTGWRAHKSLAEIRGPDYSNNLPAIQPGLSGLE
jgi:hypothetical protein